MDVVETIMDAGFDPSIQDIMDHEAHEALVEKALDGNVGAKTVYVEKFIETVRNLDEGLYKGLIRGIIRHTPERGVEEFLEEVSDRVILFEHEILDRLRQHVQEGFPVMEEPVEIELENELSTDELIFRFWTGDGTEPLAEITILDPEARPNFVRDGIHDVIAASWIPDLRRVVEDTLRDLRKNMKRREDA